MMVQPGHRIAVLTTDPNIHFAMHAAAEQGFVIVPVPMRDPPQAIASFLAAAEVDIVMTDVHHGELATQVRGERPVLIVNERAEPINDIPGQLGAPGDADIYCVLATSGTGGTPKTVTITRAQLAAHRQAAIERLACSDDSVWLAALPMWHIGGVALLDRCLHGGGKLVLLDGFDVTQVQRALESHPITHVSLVPTMLRRLLQGDTPAPASLRCVLIGGDRLDPELAKQALAAGWPVHASYGLTEACSQVATATPADLHAHPATVGRPLAGVEVRIEEGEIVVAGPTVGGEVRTGDLGRMEDGFLFVEGRADDRIVTGGENVDAQAVEAVLMQVDGVEDAGVVGIPDDEWGQRVVAFISGQPDMERVESAMQGLPRHARPKEFRVIAALPRTAGGKLQRGRLRTWGLK